MYKFKRTGELFDTIIVLSVSVCSMSMVFALLLSGVAGLS